MMQFAPFQTLMMQNFAPLMMVPEAVTSMPTAGRTAYCISITVIEPAPFAFPDLMVNPSSRVSEELFEEITTNDNNCSNCYPHTPISPLSMEAAADRFRSLRLVSCSCGNTIDFISLRNTNVLSRGSAGFALPNGSLAGK